MALSRDELRQRTHASVAAAAAELFRAKGFHATTIRDIAAAAGVSVGSVMAVGDKNALLVGMFDAEIEAIHSARIGQALRASDPVDRIVELIAPFPAMFAAHRDLAAAYSSILVGGTHTSIIFGELGATLTAEFAAELMHQGRSSEMAQSAATTIYLAYLGSLFLWSSTPDADFDDVADQLKAVIAYAIGDK